MNYFGAEKSIDSIYVGEHFAPYWSLKRDPATLIDLSKRNFYFKESLTGMTTTGNHVFDLKWLDNYFPNMMRAFVYLVLLCGLEAIEV